MDEKIVVEYITSELEKLYVCKALYIPKVGYKVVIDGKTYEVTDVEAYLYTHDCKQNKVRVYVALDEDS